jgi:hypothetical protein
MAVVKATYKIYGINMIIFLLIAMKNISLKEFKTVLAGTAG